MKVSQHFWMWPLILTLMAVVVPWRWGAAVCGVLSIVSWVVFFTRK
jgi:hypothetical protein